MRKGAMIPLFEEVNVKDRIDIIKETGFDTFMISLDRSYEKWTAKIEDMVEYCNKIGLDVNCGHAPYIEPDVVNFWKNSKLGDQIEEQYLETLKLASRCKIKTVVFHLHYGTDYELGKVGINRLKRFVNYAEKHNVNIAIENLYSYDELGYIFDKIKSPNLGMCYDCGHENFLTKGAKFLHKYGDRLKAVHLHDNDGITDEHKVPFTGSVDWNSVAIGLANANAVALEAEVKIFRQKDNYTKKELLIMFKEQYDALEKLEKMIEQQKNILTANQN